MKHIKLFESYENFVIAYHGTDIKFNSFKKMNGKVSTIFGTEDVIRSGYYFAKNCNNNLKRISIVRETGTSFKHKIYIEKDLNK